MTFGSTSTQLHNTINSVSHDFYCVGRIELKQVTMEKKKTNEKKRRGKPGLNNSNIVYPRLYSILQNTV